VNHRIRHPGPLERVGGAKRIRANRHVDVMIDPGVAGEVAVEIERTAETNVRKIGNGGEAQVTTVLARDDLDGRAVSVPNPRRNKVPTEEVVGNTTTIVGEARDTVQAPPVQRRKNQLAGNGDEAKNRKVTPWNGRLLTPLSKHLLNKISLS